MATNEVLLNNYSDDSQIKKYIVNELMPRVFHDIPLNVLNTGEFSIINEYLSQTIEQQAFTSTFYFNESFITKATLPDSIYAEAAIFNIGYSFATPSTCQFLLELKIDDIRKNAVLNPDNDLWEFILDKDTKFNLSNGNVYSLDYDIMIRYKDEHTSSLGQVTYPAWDIQYYHREQQNSIHVNKNIYIPYRVTDTWLCLFVTASEFERQTHVVANNMTNGIPNQDTVITCQNHIAGFDIKYIDGDGNVQYIQKDHILPIHSSVEDSLPYVHYIMDNPQTIRLMWQLQGTKYFIPQLNSSFEITVYTCHGEAANFTAFKNNWQPLVITASSRYTNNANVVKAAFVISGSANGTNIGTVESVRRETIEAYNTANVISSDHDLEEYFKTFYFKNILYPFFFKRRDDPWGRIWSGYVALKDEDDYIFRTNTLHANISYSVLYNNNDNTFSNNEIIIPPGWIWIYGKENRFTVIPYTKGNDITIETAKTLASIPDQFIFSNPFGIRIQKDPFAIGYFNPWINEYCSTTMITKVIKNLVVDNHEEDISYIYHAVPILVNVKRTYKDNYYKITTDISTTTEGLINGEEFVKYLRTNAMKPVFVDQMWKYFKEPLDYFSSTIPMITRSAKEGYLPFNPDQTFFCVKYIEALDSQSDYVGLVKYWIEDLSDGTMKRIVLPITSSTALSIYGDKALWDENGIREMIPLSGNTDITLTSNDTETLPVQFERLESQNYYEMRIKTDDTISNRPITKITIDELSETELTKYGEMTLYKLGGTYQTVVFNVYYEGSNTPYTYEIHNAANVYIPYAPNASLTENGMYEIQLSNLQKGDIVLYADMKPTTNNENQADYYRIRFSDIPDQHALFYLNNSASSIENNNMRIVLHALMNGTETGYVEMYPIKRNTDGSIRFEATMYPLNQLVDVDNRIHIASTRKGGGNWIPKNANYDTINIDATNPELKISVLFRSDDIIRDSEITLGDSFTGFRISDEYMIDDLSLIQELKEMRSVVNFGDSSTPTLSQITLYHACLDLYEYNPNQNNLNTIMSYAYQRARVGIVPTNIEFSTIQETAIEMIQLLTTYRNDYYEQYLSYQNHTLPSVIPAFNTTISWLTEIKNYIPHIYRDKTSMYTYWWTGDGYLKTAYHSTLITEGYYDAEEDKFYSDKYHQLPITPEEPTLNWSTIYAVLSAYPTFINQAFSYVNINGGVEIQQVPFVYYDLMNDDRFESFVASFTQLHKAMEPVIMHRLEGNNYLDCKLIATYGLPHSYSSDLDKNDETRFWPDLNVQLEFDVKFYNQALVSNTSNELKAIIKAYFNRLTTIHTPKDMMSMDHNIYISHVIQQLEAHDNVAYVKFKGWYTHEKNKVNGKYMDANIQAIVQKWDQLEKFPTNELERFVPEMFVLEDQNIIINNIDDGLIKKQEEYLQKRTY